MTDYHVGAGLCGIYAGKLNSNKNMWIEKSDVTDEAIGSVRDYMVEQLLGGTACKITNASAYQWKLKDGRIVELKISINNPQKIIEGVNLNGK